MLLRQNAFTENNKMLKGALHCHTTRSDGRGEPAEVIRLHKENGYDFMALTDHRFYNYENFAPETDMTIIPGMEFDNTFYRDKGFRTWHIVCVGPKKEDGNGYDQDQRIESGTAKTQEEFQPYLDEIHAKNNLTIYAHPEWSSTPARYFDQLKGNFAMEIWNSGCAIDNGMDTNAAYWDELLGQGQKIFGVATDDGHAMSNHCNGWVMVNAENNVNAILEALKNGAFYSSTGPIIKDFYVKDGVVHVECSEVAEVDFICDCHPTRRKLSQNGDITSAELDLTTQSKSYKNIVSYPYIRVSVVDKDGHRAWTNPIWFDQE